MTDTPPATDTAGTGLLRRYGHWLARRRGLRRKRRRLLLLWTLDSLGRATGLEVDGVTGLPASAVWPLLHYLEEEGLVASEWEVPEPLPDGRPRRRYYRTTPAGRAFADDTARELRSAFMQRS